MSIERYGEDNKEWFKFCPDTFLTLAPLEYKQNPEIWTVLFNKYETQILQYIPINLKNNPEFFLQMLNVKKNLFPTLSLNFTPEVLNSISVIQVVLEKYPEHISKTYKELYVYLKKHEDKLSGMSNLEKFKLLFNDKILEQTIPIHKISTVSKKVNKF